MDLWTIIRIFCAAVGLVTCIFYVYGGIRYIRMYGAMSKEGLTARIMTDDDIVSPQEAEKLLYTSQLLVGSCFPLGICFLIEFIGLILDKV